MLEFSPVFFNEEIRDGFRVTGTMKKAWAAQMTVLDMVLEIADRHGIKVYMDYGSLLGTVRHHGYIPWDDDIDICVMRDGYMKLLMFLNDELPSYCKVLSFYTKEKYFQPKAFVTNRTIVDEGGDEEQAEISRKYRGFPYMTGLDLYPLDYVPSDPGEWEYIKNLYNAVYDLAMQFELYKATGELEGFLQEIEGIVKQKIKRDEHIKDSLWLLADKIAMMTKRGNSRHVMWYPDAMVRTTDMRRKLSWYSETVKMPFENMTVPVPSGYEGILAEDYGAEYMTPKQSRAAHTYPFYLEQDRIILERRYKKDFTEII